MTRRLFFLFLALAILLIPMAAAAGIMGIGRGTVTTAADDMAEAIDKQILGHFGVEQPGFFSKSEQKHHPVNIRRALSISCTVAVDLNNLESTSPVGRQISEEMARWFVQAGYKVKEIRKGKDVHIDATRGEMVLTRDVRKLLSTNVTTEAVLAGTYVVTPEQVRFSMRLLHVPSNDILGMATATVPITEDLKPLLHDMKETKVVPSIGTQLK
ncbi:MAG: FlgO family outer membrane protein [Betaproteobacteria bacterium]|nr:FlgO family outer membrane protein [Betaproteobacteria bacterium]